MDRTPRHFALASALVAAGLLVVAPAAVPAGDFSSTCPQLEAGTSQARAADCMSCHRPRDLRKDHPIDVDYRTAEAASRFGAVPLRPLEEAVKRGMFLPDGKITCLTCHDPRSPWKYHLAIPPGAKPGPAVHLEDPKTYEDGPELNRAAAMLAAQAAQGQRPDAGRKTLCLSCHAAD